MPASATQGGHNYKHYTYNHLSFIQLYIIFTVVTVDFVYAYTVFSANLK